MSELSCIEIEPKNKANSAVIWLHGLGASGDDFAPLAEHLTFNTGIEVRFVFPHAPQRSVSINGGARMSAWYDLAIEGVERKVNLDDLTVSTNQVLALIEAQRARGVPSDRIVLAGFSQGGAVAYEALFRCPYPLAGVMAMSTYIAHPEALGSAAYIDTPVWISHGNRDDVVPLALGKRAQSDLADQGFEPSFSEYSMAHNVCPSQVKDIQTFLDKVLAT